VKLKKPPSDFFNDHGKEEKASISVDYPEPFVMLRILRISYDKTIYCQAAVISPSILLSRAACFKTKYGTVPPSNVTLLDPQKYKNTRMHEIILHDAYTPDQIGFGDLAILKLTPLSWSTVKISQDPWPGFLFNICYFLYKDNHESRGWIVYASHSSKACFCMDWVTKRRTVISYSSVTHDFMYGNYSGGLLVCNENLVGILVATIDPKSCSKYTMVDDKAGDRVLGNVSFQMTFIYLCPYISWIAENTNLDLKEPLSCGTVSINEEHIKILLFIIVAAIWELILKGFLTAAA